MKNKENLKKGIIQFIKFGTVGAINTVLSYAITNGAYYLLHLHEQISNIIAFVITVFISFMLNGRFVFTENKEERNFWKSLLASYSLYGWILGLYQYTVGSIPSFLNLSMQYTLHGAQHVCINNFISIPLFFLSLCMPKIYLK